MMQIIPAILSSDPKEAGELLEKIVNDGRFIRAQIDFIDGEYANNRTVRVEELESLSKYKLKFDAHLMVIEKNIGEWARKAKEAGFERIIPQVESISKPENFLGLALDIHSPVAAIQPYLDKLEVVVMMAVEPGFGGQQFNDEVVNKIRRLEDIRKTMGYKFKICVDGGVEKENLEELERVGVDEVAVGVSRVLLW